jgi:hypothetical protein
MDYFYIFTSYEAESTFYSLTMCTLINLVWSEKHGTYINKLREQKVHFLNVNSVRT